MTELRDGDFEIDGYRMGESHPIFIDEFDLGTIDTRDQDSLNPVGSDRYFGRDRLTPPIWSLGASAMGDGAAEALASLGSIAAKWRTSDLHKPGWETILRYRVADRTRLVYGRPRNLRPKPGHGLTSGYVPLIFEFACSDHLFYDDAGRSVSVDGMPAEGGGLTPPFTTPVLLAPAGSRSGVISDVGGDASAPVTVTIFGPTAGPVSVKIGGAEMAFTSLPLAFDRSVTIDTRKSTVLRDDGASLAGLLSRRTYLPEVRLQPGTAEVVFNGPAGARCLVGWRPAFYGF